MTDRNESEPITQRLLHSKECQSKASVLPYKFAFFALFAARGSVVSFFPLYLRQIGLTADKIGIVMFSRPVGGFLGSAFTSFLTSVFANDSIVLYLMACLFIMAGTSINFMSSPPLAISCNSSVRDLVFNISSETESVIEPSDHSWVDDNIQYLFVCSILIGFAVDFSGIGIDTVQHGVTMMALGKENSEMYGGIRAWGALGHSVGVVSTGLLIWSKQRTLKICAQFITAADYHFFSYSVMFFAFALLLSVNTTCVSTEKKEDGSVKENEKSLADRKELLGTLCSRDILPWLFVLMSRSMFCAVSQGFLNLRMGDIGASPLLIGASNGVTTLTEFSMFLPTPFLIRRFGHTPLAIVGITSYIIRFWIFSVLTQPLYILPVEILEGVMYAILWSSIVSHLSSQVSGGKQRQMQGVILSLHMMGTGIGYLLSGYLTHILGAQLMFQIFACMAAFVSLSFIASQSVHLKCKNSQH